LSGANDLTYEQLSARLKEMDALLASIRKEEVDAIIGEKRVVLLSAARKFEEAMLESREHFRMIYDASPMAIALFGPDGKMIHANKSCLNLFGAPDVGDILSFDILSQKLLPKETFESVLSGNPVNYQSRFDFADAASHGLMNCWKTGVLFLDIFMSPMLRPGEKTVSGYLVKILDITTHRLAMDHVTFQARLLESVDEAVVATGMDDRITYWGRGAEKMFGNSEQEMIGSHVGDLFFSKGLFEDMVIQSEEKAAAEYAKLRSDGSVLWLSTTLSLIKNSEGNIEGIVGVLRDITHRKMAEEALKDREKQLEMLYQKHIISLEDERKRLSRELHDSLGQKIISMQLEIEWLKNHKSENAVEDVYKNLLGITVDTSEELHHICLGLRPLIMDRIGFNAAIKSLLLEFETNCDVAIESRIMPVDETRISPDAAINSYRILQESLTNVVRHSNSKKAFVSLQEEGSELVLEVKDEGRGLPECKLPNSYNFGILGMRERAKMSGGHFEINSTPEKGTCIKVSIPIRKPDGEANV